MTLALIILILPTFINAQLLIFPDQYESTLKMYSYKNEENTSPVSSLSNFPMMSDSPFDNLGTYWKTRVSNLISRGVAKFALDMDNSISIGNNNASSLRENIIFSPLSLAGTMTMVLLGSSGKTFEEVSHILGFEVELDISRHSEVVHQIFGLLLSSISDNLQRPTAPRVNYASGLFVQEGFSIRPEFKTICEVVYKSEVRNLDFAKKGAEALRQVNEWVSQKTMEKIPSILSMPPHPATKVIIASALYFNGEWSQHFIDGATRRKEFFIEPDQSIDVDMMYNGGEFPFYEDKALGAKILGLPYKNNEISMYVILPNEKGARALKNFKNRLTADILDDLIRNMKNETCIIGLPRMKLSSSLRLRDAFRRLGLQSLFNPSTADLSLLSPGYGEENISPLSAPAPPSSFQQQPCLSPQGIPVPCRPVTRDPRLPYQDRDILIFSRLGDENDTERSNVGHIRYTVDDYNVDQWNSGFTIKKINNEGQKMQERKEEPRKKRDAFMGNARRLFRKKRQQQRPIDQAFLEFMRSQNFQSFGLDDIRNSGRTRNPGLFADEVYHKTVMDITEKGTEAAAVTVVSLNRDGSQKRMVADRPFLFFIRHDSSKLLLFWGTVNAPTPNYQT